MGRAGPSEERKQEARRLRLQHNRTWADIAAYYGVSVGTVRRWVNDQERIRQNEKALAWKDNNAHACPDCGIKLIRHDHQRCLDCANKHTGRKRRGTGPVIANALTLFADGQPHRYTEIRLHLGVSKNRLATVLSRMLNYNMIERIAYGVYRKR